MDSFTDFLRIKMFVTIKVRVLETITTCNNCLITKGNINALGKKLVVIV